MFKKLRFWLFKITINISLSLADKSTVEGLGWLMAVQNWLTYINSDEADRAREKYTKELV